MACSSCDKEDTGKALVSLLNAFHIVPFTSVSTERPSSAVRVAEQLVLLCDIDVFHPSLSAQQLQRAQNLLPVSCAAHFCVLVCCHRHIAHSCRAGQNLVASPLKESLPWTKWIKYFSSVEGTWTNRKI